MDLVSRDFIRTNFNYPIQVLVLPDRASFQKFLRDEFKEKNPPNFGIYLPRLRLFATYENSGYGTFAHEIMHPFVEQNLPDRPWWAVEAIPAFFEKFFGYYENNTMVVQWGYQNPWRIDALGARLSKVDLESLVTDNALWGEADTSALRLITVFLWQQGKLPRLLRLIADRNHNGFPSYFEAAMSMRLKDVLPLWKKYLDDIQAHRTEVMQIPSSEIFENKVSFSRFMSTRRLPITGEK